MARISYDEKKQEAIQRLKMMGVDNRMVIKPFKKGKLMLSEYLDEFFPAVLYLSLIHISEPTRPY